MLSTDTTFNDESFKNPIWFLFSNFFFSSLRRETSSPHCMRLAFVDLLNELLHYVGYFSVTLLKNCEKKKKYCILHTAKMSIPKKKSIFFYSKGEHMVTQRLKMFAVTASDG